jgi:hypothetical protein
VGYFLIFNAKLPKSRIFIRALSTTMSSPSVAQDSILVSLDIQPTLPTLRCAQGQALESGGLSSEAYRNLGLQAHPLFDVTL